MRIEFFCPGLPKGAGSKSAFAVKKQGAYTGKVIVTDSSGAAGKHWRSEVTSIAFKTMADLGLAPLQEAVILRCKFIMPRPKHHYGTGRNSGVLKDNAPSVHTSAPDATKLVRAVEDSLKNLCWRDDAQVVEQHIFKRYGDQPGCHVTIVPYAEEMILRESLPKVDFALEVDNVGSPE
jgi:crossover junction endodeoxyribonuclease RusA